MKLYISYYGNYISIVEGFYNNKKQKYIIKNIITISDEDVDIDYSDKYSLLKYALGLNKFKSKNVVFSLNTRDVIIKSNTIQKVGPKDLDGIMNNEIDEMMSLESDRYIFSYEVTKESEQDGEHLLDVILAGVATEEIENILEIFKNNNLNVECIDTMSTAYSRVMKDMVYDDIMMINIGRYGSIVNIYKEDTLFMYDNIPVKINHMTNYSVCLALVDEVKGLTNFYSSRNFGKNIDTMLLIGEEFNNPEVINTFKESFQSNIISGIENLIDINDDIQGDLIKGDLSKIVDVLGSMRIVNDSKNYSSMNLLPLYQRNKINKINNLKKALMTVPLAGVLLVSPYFILDTLNNNTIEEINKVQIQLDNMILEYKGIENIEEEISKNQEKLDIYEMLSDKNIKWEGILESIDKNIPYKVDLTNIMVKYEPDSMEGSIEDESNEENSGSEEQSESDNKDENTEQSNSENESETESENPIYDQIPNVIYLDGNASSHTHIGQFVYNLSQVKEFKTVELKETLENEEDNIHSFSIVVYLKEDVISNEQE